MIVVNEWYLFIISSVLEMKGCKSKIYVFYRKKICYGENKINIILIFKIVI